MSDRLPADVSMREIAELVRLFDESDWVSLELDIHGMHLVLGRNGVPSSTEPRSGSAEASPARTAAETPAAKSVESLTTGDSGTTDRAASAVQPAPPPLTGSDLVEVRSPVVGAFWVAPSPGEPPFVTVGDMVTEGQQLAIVEVMKLMSDVSTSTAGRVVEVCANNSDMVEYDQVLFKIDPGQADG